MKRKVFLSLLSRLMFLKIYIHRLLTHGYVLDPPESYLNQAPTIGLVDPVHSWHYEENLFFLSESQNIFLTG